MLGDVPPRRGADATSEAVQRRVRSPENVRPRSEPGVQVHVAGRFGGCATRADMVHGQVSGWSASRRSKPDLKHDTSWDWRMGLAV